jgi:hypothetical protein
VRQHEAALDHQGQATCCLDTGSAHGLAGDLVAADQHGGRVGAVHGINISEALSAAPDMVPIGQRAKLAGIDQVGLGGSHLYGEAQTAGVHGTSKWGIWGRAYCTPRNRGGVHER